MRYLAAAALLLGALHAICAGQGEAARSESPLAITVGEAGGWPEVRLENDVYRAVIRLNPGGGEYGNEHAIRDWVIKSADRDIVSAFIDACAQRPPLVRAQTLGGDANHRSVRLFYAAEKDAEPVAVLVYTIFANSPVIRVDYEKYPSWTNTVDITDIGESRDGRPARAAQTRVHGQQDFQRQYGRGIVFHEESYWNTYDEEYAETDPVDGGPLSYRGHLIMVVGEPESGTGFGRVMPVKTAGAGGVKILKLLWNRGFECFPATGQDEREPFTGYIYCFTGGLEKGMEMGKRIVDGDEPKMAGGESAVAEK